jgi:hypothetical protein
MAGGNQRHGRVEDADIEAALCNLPTNKLQEALIPVHRLQRVTAALCSQLVNEPTVNKILKNIPAAPLKTLCLDFGECEEVANLGKVFGISSGGSIIEKLERIENFSINVE